jgi:hypothetical protein
VDGTEPNGFIYLAWLGAILLALGLFNAGIGFLRKSK